VVGLVPVFMIERRYAEEFTPSTEGAAEVRLVNDDEDVHWLYSFLSADKRKSFCLYEAESADAIRAHADNSVFDRQRLITPEHHLRDPFAVLHDDGMRHRIADDHHPFVRIV
jgi:hypothetical protein